ncbi:MAG: hypothetical protein AB7O50_06805 [Pseudolabrys sp.]
MTADQHSTRFGRTVGGFRLPRRWPFPRGRVKWSALRRGIHRVLRRKWVMRSLIGVGAVSALTVVTVLGLWWRLASGPIEFDLATAWLKSAIEENLGAKYKVAIGGTQLERDERGHPSLRILDVAVRDEDGVLVAAAPKAEIGLSGSSLLTGHIRASSLNLVGAELSVRIEPDGQVAISAGAASKPLTRAPLPAAAKTLVPEAPGQTAQPGVNDLAAALGWIDRIGTTGLDGYDLRQIGLKNGSLTVDDQRTGKRWSFTDISVGLSRPEPGGVIVRLASEAPQRRWQISAAIRPLADNVRAVGIEARDVPAHDILLALRVGGVDAEFPLSASIRAELSTGGVLRSARGQVIAGAGYIRDPDQAGAEVRLEQADIRMAWDSRQKSLVVPFQLQAQGAQVTMLARIDAADASDGTWRFSVMRGDNVIDPIILSPGSLGQSGSFAFNRVSINGKIDPRQQRIVVEQGDFGREDTRAAYNVGVAVTGSFDFSGADPRLNFGVAGTRMPVAVLKRLWPAPVAPPVRNWVETRIASGTVERVLIAANMPMSVMLEKGVPIPDEALSIEIDTSATVFRPVAALPEIRDADLSVRVTGRTAHVGLGRGTLEVSGGRRLNIASGRFDVPDTHPPDAPAKAVFRIDGSIQAAAALLASEQLRGVAGLKLDPATSRGTMSTQLALDLTIARRPEDVQWRYVLSADLNNFAAERLLAGQKVEAQSLKVSANSDGYSVRGDVKINGTSANLDFRKSRDNPRGELKLSASLDDAARRRAGIDFGTSVTGTVPVTLTGDVELDATDLRLNVEADFTAARIDNLLPGWVKPAGRGARATFLLIRDAKLTRFEELNISGDGAQARGSVELDAAGDLVSANFPVFGLSEGDKATLRAERVGSGVLKVALRGDVYDGRNAVKSLLGTPHEPGKRRSSDVDLEIRLGTVAGFNGETLRGLELRFNRRGGRVRSFILKAKIGRDAPLIGDIRLRSSDNHQVVYLETDDAGALFRFTDTYPRMFGGQMWTAMDPPNADDTPQIGVLSIRNFVIRGEPGLERVISGAPESARSAVEFTELRADFTRQAGRMTIRDGVVRGPTIGATIDGTVDFPANAMRLRGTFVPLYAINNVFGQIPIVGLFLGGGSKEGLLGVNYEASGPPSAPRITINPISAVAPGLLRKMLPAPSPFDPNYVRPVR